MQTIGIKVSDRQLRERLDNVCIEAVKIWGPSLQWTVLMEECAELIKAISKFKRSGQDPAMRQKSISNLMKECVDVQIMLVQASIILGMDETVDNIFFEKVSKLEDMLIPGGHFHYGDHVQNPDRAINIENAIKQKEIENAIKPKEEDVLPIVTNKVPTWIRTGRHG